MTEDGRDSRSLIRSRTGFVGMTEKKAGITEEILLPSPQPSPLKGEG
jgi:hypothetical protein